MMFPQSFTCLLAVRCLLAILLPCILTGSTTGQSAAVTPTELNHANLARDIDTILDASFEENQPGATAIVVVGGQVVYESARGMANLELQVPMQPEMVFRIGSITKQFTAAAIMLLVEDGKVSLSDELTKFLPDYPMQGTKVTVEHLLTHTSGIRSYTGIPGWMDTKVINELSVQELIDGFKNEPMDFDPGTKFRYNNSGYVLLGAIIEKASGQSYAQFIQERVFDPLNMGDSYYGDHAKIIMNRVAGYDGPLERPKNAKYLSMSQPYAAGSLLSNVADLAKWNSALFGEKVVNADSLKRMITNYKLSDGSLAGYGYGLVPGQIRGHQAISHGGGIFGFVTHGIYLPEEEVYVAVLCNSTSLNPAPIARKIAALAVSDPYPDFTEIKVSEEILQRYVGVYRIDERSVRVVSLKNGKLFTKRTGSIRLRAIPSSETEFFYETAPSHIEFLVDPNGNVSGMKMHPLDSGEPETALKVDEPVESPNDQND